MSLDEKQLEVTELPQDAAERAHEEIPSAETAEIYETSEEILREAGRDVYPKKRRETNEYVKIGGSLLVICAVVALVVSFVHAVTADMIAEAAVRERREAVVRIFGEGAAITEIEPLAGTNTIYAIADAGYCVNLDAKGFGGPVSMMVGVGYDGRLVGIEIVSHSETPGFGAKADDPAYLAQYIGQGSRLVLGDTVDALAGATITSRAVLGGVNAATAALVEAGLVEEFLPPPPVEEESIDDWGDLGEYEDWMDDADGGDGE